MFEDEWNVRAVPNHHPAALYAGPDTRVDAGAECRGNVVLGAHCGVAMGAHVENVVCWDGVEIPSDASVEDCVLTEGVAVPSGRELSGKLVMRVEKDAAGLRRREIQDGLVITNLKRERVRGL